MKNTLLVLTTALLCACHMNQGSGTLQSAAQNAKLAQSCPSVIGDSELASIPERSVAHGQVTLADSRVIHYTLTAGYLPIFEDGQQHGDIRACLFYWSYARDDQSSNPKWPVSFLFNGGPTVSSSWIQFGGMAPKILDLGREGITIPNTPSLRDNPFTLLANSDLVFIDPINTGLSRPAQTRLPEDFNGLIQDAHAVGNAIQMFLTTFPRVDAPKYIVGESYGGMRTPVLARYLIEKLNISLAGTVLVSPWFDAIGDTFGTNMANDLPYVLYLPEYTTVAWYHHKLSPDLQALSLEDVYEKSRLFAENNYLVSLAKGDDLAGDERTQLTNQLSQLTSFSNEFVASKNLRISIDDFTASLLKDEGKTISPEDGRVSAVLKPTDSQDPMDLFGLSFLNAVETTLVDLKIGFQKKFVDQYTPPLWPGANPKGIVEGGYLNVMEDITFLLNSNPNFRVLIASGYFDYQCPMADVAYLARHLPVEIRSRLKINRYAAGHAIYFGDQVHEQFANDLSYFYGDSLKIQIQN